MASSSAVAAIGLGIDLGHMSARNAVSCSEVVSIETRRLSPSGIGTPAVWYRALTPVRIICWRAGGSMWFSRTASVTSATRFARSGGSLEDDAEGVSDGLSAYAGAE
jgi:hypothetical protein